MILYEDRGSIFGCKRYWFRLTPVEHFTTKVTSVNTVPTIKGRGTILDFKLGYTNGMRKQVQTLFFLLPETLSAPPPATLTLSDLGSIISNQFHWNKAGVKNLIKNCGKSLPSPRFISAYKL